eukprot:m.145170 g.145170  ORF g.145170 m.145170 type:complete len:614 (+) comp38414_c0_seq4:1803-3644(+)
MLVLTSAALTVLETIFLLLGFLMDHDAKYAEDYRIAAGRTLASGKESRWRSTDDKDVTHTINFWCFNPAVAFSYVGSVSRCIVLSSGTLSPMNTFASELGAEFPLSLEANHVIPKSQVWVGTVAVGPNNVELDGRYQTSGTYRYQDEIGQIVLSVCKTVPHGVLCFLPSYSHVEKLISRWSTTGLLGGIERAKSVFYEQRGSDKADFDAILQDFYSAVRESGEETTYLLKERIVMSLFFMSEANEGGQGALLLAVCRGKVSEGLDFADNNARAVITVGIPYPNWNSVQVEQKRLYNDCYSVKRGLLSGKQWYEIQAFRALNQALGRCLRHRNDWGALIMIDERFGKNPRCVQGLSKWIRQYVKHFRHFNDALTSLDQFSKDRLCSHPQDANSSSFASQTLPQATAVSPLTSTPVADKTLPSPDLFPEMSQSSQENVDGEKGDNTMVVGTRKRDQRKVEDDSAQKRPAPADEIELPAFFESGLKSEAVKHCLTCAKCGTNLADDGWMECQDGADLFQSIFRHCRDGADESIGSWVVCSRLLSETCVGYPVKDPNLPFPGVVSGECNGLTFMLLCCSECQKGSGKSEPVGVKIFGGTNFIGKAFLFAPSVLKKFN